ncbi:hypothetical protein Ct61P_08000 [Colletotrichum tofieldiae]|nr:hypothetical protein Ct61P_08000 [Colletotrichum tofieldiae]
MAPAAFGSFMCGKALPLWLGTDGSFIQVLMVVVGSSDPSSDDWGNQRLQRNEPRSIEMEQQTDEMGSDTAAGCRDADLSRVAVVCGGRGAWCVVRGAGGSERVDE